MYSEDSGSRWDLGIRNLWVAIFFFPGESIEIEVEPEQVEKPGARSPGKLARDFWVPSQGGAKPVLEMKPRNREWVRRWEVGHSHSSRRLLVPISHVCIADRL